MAERLKIVEVFVFEQGGVHTYRGEDGDYSFLTSPVVAKIEDGRHFLLPTIRQYTDEERREYRARYEDGELYGPVVLYWPAESEDKAAAVRAVGSINPDLWVEVEMDYRSTEQRFHDEWEREQYERMGYGAVDW